MAPNSWQPSIWTFRTVSTDWKKWLDSLLEKPVTFPITNRRLHPWRTQFIIYYFSLFSFLCSYYPSKRTYHCRTEKKTFTGFNREPSKFLFPSKFFWLPSLLMRSRLAWIGRRWLDPGLGLHRFAGDTQSMTSSERNVFDGRCGSHRRHDWWFVAPWRRGRQRQGDADLSRRR